MSDSKPATKMRRITYAQWEAEGTLRFGESKPDWRFECPSCGHVATPRQWMAAGASEGEIAFSCVGRRTGAGEAKTFKRAGGPCNYAGGGLFKLNPVTVEFEDGTTGAIFEFAGDATGAQ